MEPKYPLHQRIKIRLVHTKTEHKKENRYKIIAMSRIFTEDALIEQPAIRLFKDVLEWLARDLLLPRLVSGECGIRWETSGFGCGGGTVVFVFA